MNTPAPGTWVAHDGQPNQIWQVARLETRGGTTYARLHHPHRRTNGHFSPDPKAPETMTVVAAELTAVDPPKELTGLPKDTNSRPVSSATTPARQSFADQEDTIKKGAFFVQSPSLKPGLAPVAFMKTVGGPINESTETIVLTEAFPARLGPTDGNVRHLAPMRIKLSESTLTPVSVHRPGTIARDQLKRTLGKDAAQHLFDRTKGFTRSTLGDVISLARTIDRIDDVVLSKRSIQEAYELLSMLDDGYLLWDKLMLMLSTEPKAGILWYERLERLLNALPETNGLIPVKIRNKYAAEVKRLGYGTENAFTPTPDDPAGQGYHAIGTSRAAKLVRPNPDNDGLPIYYLWDTDDEVYYLFSPSQPVTDLGSRTAAEAKADFTPKELTGKPKKADSRPVSSAKRQPFSEQKAVWEKGVFFVDSPDIPAELGDLFFTYAAGEPYALPDGAEKVMVEEYYGESDEMHHKRNKFTIKLSNSTIFEPSQLVGKEGTAMQIAFAQLTALLDDSDGAARELMRKHALSAQNWGWVVTTMRSLNRIDETGPSAKALMESLQHYLDINDETLLPKFEALADKDPKAARKEMNRWLKASPSAWYLPKMQEYLAQKAGGKTPNSRLQTPDSPPLTAPLIEAHLRTLARRMAKETDSNTLSVLAANQRTLERALTRA